MHSALRLPAQRGNTFVGIIIGLVIGLAIAVVVALMITKGATPFSDKLAKTGKAPEPSAGQIADPNQPMYGKTVREAAPESAPADAVPTPPPADALAQVIASFKNEPDLKSDVKRDARPLARAERDARSVPAPVPAPAPDDDKWVYYLQVGAFRASADAETARAKMALLGFEAAVTERNTDNGVLHRVRLGPYTQLDAMNRVRSKLSDGGVDVAIIRNPK